MKPLELTYNAIISTLGTAALPLIRSKAKQDPEFWRGRLGHPALPQTMQRPRIWCHAASVGEVTGAIPTLRALKAQLPEAFITLSVGTPQGFRFARTQGIEGVAVIPYPLDMPWAVRQSLEQIRPDLYVALESEFWPNVFRLLRERKIPTLLLNGRLTTRSARRYQRLHRLFAPIFAQFSWLAMHSEADRANVLRCGAPASRTLVLGSSKYDGLRARVQPENAAAWRERLALPDGAPVLIGGSLRRSECTQLMEVYRSLTQHSPELIGIFVPRHLERVPEMVEWLSARELPFERLSEIEAAGWRRTAPIVVVDRIGVLFELYALGDLIFCGGTLEPIGGHNILEPSAWGKAVFYGPHVQKVEDEHRALTAHAGSFMVAGAEELLTQWSHWLERLPELARHGAGAAEALSTLTGAADRQVALIVQTLASIGQSIDG